MKKVLSILILCLIVCGCENAKKNPISINKNIEAVMSENNYIIVDVRTKEEYEISHVVGAINIPVDDIDENVDLDKSKAILVYCQSGNRSNMAYNYLTNLGYEVYDLGAFSKLNLEKE